MTDPVSDELDARRRILLSIDDESDRAAVLAVFARVDQRRYHEALGLLSDSASERIEAQQRLVDSVETLLRALHEEGRHPAVISITDWRSRPRDDPADYLVLQDETYELWAATR